MNNHIKTLILIASVSILTFGVPMVNMCNEFNLFADNVKGNLYYSDGANLYKYDFNSKVICELFSQKKAIESNKDVSNVVYPNYLKISNKIVFIGYSGPLGTHNIYESNLEMNQWTENKILTDIKQFSISPDGDKIAYGRLKMNLTNCEDVLPKDYRYELFVVSFKMRASESHRMVTDDYSGFGCFWQTNDILLYRDLDSNTVRCDLRTGEKRAVLEGFSPVGISNDGAMLLCTKKNAIFTVMSDTYTPVLAKKINGYNGSGCIVSPDKKYFIFSKIRSFELPVTSETKDVWIYNLNDNSEELLIKGGGPIFGGFWIE